MRDLLLGIVVAAALWLIWKKEVGHSAPALPGAGSGASGGAGANGGSGGGTAGRGTGGGGCGGNCGGTGAASPSAQSMGATGPFVPNSALSSTGQGAITPTVGGPIGGSVGTPNNTSYNPLPSKTQFKIRTTSVRATSMHPTNSGFHIVRNLPPAKVGAPAPRRITVQSGASPVDASGSIRAASGKNTPSAALL
jgi:hypothetical protein